jgi:hypothetical protein
MNMNSDSFPPGLPEHLPEAAFVSSGGQEVAWKQSDCTEVIDWLSSNGHAVLGTELWPVRNGEIRTLINTKNGPVLHCPSCDPLPKEDWSEYVQRSARLAAAQIADFSWPQQSNESPIPPISISLGRTDSGSVLVADSWALRSARCKGVARKSERSGSIQPSRISPPKKANAESGPSTDCSMRKPYRFPFSPSLNMYLIAGL